MGGPRRVPEAEVPQGVGEGPQPQGPQVLAEALGLRLVRGQHQGPAAGLLAQRGDDAAFMNA